MSSALESEDLENVPLVRMEDVQPSRTYDLLTRRRSGEMVLLDTCVIEDIEYDNECIVNDDDDSNIGSMVSIQSEEVVEGDSDPEMIVPEMAEETAVAYPQDQQCSTPYQINAREDLDRPPSSWPTLEILPGGVIKKPDNCDNSELLKTEQSKPEEMMYACAKCPQTFKYLFCLVKHVKWHEDQAKKLTDFRSIKEIKPIKTPRDFCCIKTKKKKMVITLKPHKKKSPKKLKS